ncbi:hypothetical protein I316_05638 [Kwoniella heveanensis BCC8398]|uniref:Uncharacterized protein n=1 Tax=Kwoniella heveanensis BCC8398 TaxID=1296120 RepID=A0A1B9GNX0_9TREE|nr:hypothetical protein I316_05638 [Kwoniella heveanensis BCC8398]
MFTPLSKGSERAQDKLWETRADRTHSPRKIRVRPPIPTAGPSTAQPSSNVASSSAVPLPAKGDVKGKGKAKLLGGELRGVASGLAVGPRYKRKPRRMSGVEMEEKEGWAKLFFRPSRMTVERWLSSWWKRHFVLVVLPCIAVWVWVAIPFPVSDPYKDDPFPDIPSWPKRPKGDDPSVPSEDDPADDSGSNLPLDANFYFFLFWFFGMYLAVALFFITNLFSLYRLNWWPSKLGGKLSYFLSWSVTLLVGLTAHHLDLFNLRKRRVGRNDDPIDSVDWERKTFWVTLSFMAMLMPAIACFSKLKRDKRHTYRQPLSAVTATFLGGHLSRRFPASWLRFLWFMTCLAIACFSLIAGQAYASLYLTTLPHTSLDAGTWVYSWVITVQLLAQVSFFILGAKVRSRALLFLYKLFFQLVYHVFYRNLFARLRSPTQYATVQLLSSISVIIIFPLQMSRPYHRLLEILVGYPTPWEEHVENVATSFYCRGLAQNVTMVGFLGWLTILHFGPNQHIYPFFRLEPTPEDPYTFPLTFTASSVIWGSELVSSFVARMVMSLAFGVNVSQIGLDEMREYPELGWASVHVSMNILLFLIKLNFR